MLKLALMLVTVLFTVGCRSSRPMPVLQADLASPAAVDLAAILARPTLGEAELLVLVQAHPRVEAARQRARSTAGEAWQRERRPNPSVGMEIEDLVLDDMDPGRSTTWIGYSQPLVIGDRLETARRLGKSEIAAEDQAIRGLVHELQSQVRLAWAEMAYLDRRRVLLQDLIAEVEAIRDLLQKRIDGGAAAVAEMARVDLHRESMRGEQRQAERRLRTLELRLPLWLGRVDLEPERFCYRLDESPGTPALPGIEDHPLLQQARHTVDVAREALAHERALAVPDVEVGISVGRDHDADEELVELGISVPWTVFDRRQGSIAAAEAHLAAAESMVVAIELELRTTATALQSEIAGQNQALAGHDARILPAAEADFRQTAERFRAGKATLLDLLDSLRGHAGARLDRLDLLNERNRSIAALKNLTTFPESHTP